MPDLAPPAGVLEIILVDIYLDSLFLLFYGLIYCNVNVALLESSEKSYSIEI